MWPWIDAEHGSNLISRAVDRKGDVARKEKLSFGLDEINRKDEARGVGERLSEPHRRIVAGRDGDVGRHVRIVRKDEDVRAVRQVVHCVGHLGRDEIHLDDAVDRVGQVERVRVAGRINGRVSIRRIDEDVLGPLRIIGHLLFGDIIMSLAYFLYE